MSARKQRFFRNLQLAAHKLQKAADREISAVTDLTASQAIVLTLLNKKDGVSQKYVANELGQNESAITAMVNRLIRLGYVDRTRSAVDARAWELRVTESGLEQLSATTKPFASVFKRLDAQLSENEVALLEDMLLKISKALDDFD